MTQEQVDTLLQNSTLFAETRQAVQDMRDSIETKTAKLLAQNDSSSPERGKPSNISGAPTPPSPQREPNSSVIDLVLDDADEERAHAERNCEAFVGGAKHALDRNSKRSKPS